MSEENSQEQSLVADEDIRIEPKRQWVSLSQGSCDVRIGNGSVDQLSAILKASGTGRNCCALLVEETAANSIVELVKMQLADAGFELFCLDIKAIASPCVDDLLALQHRFVSAHITADDLVCAIGTRSTFYLASSLCQTWCAGVSLACIACDLPSALCAIAPFGLDIDGCPQLVVMDACPKYLLVDFDFIRVDPQEESFRLACALMAKIALSESERSFSSLWDRSSDIMACDMRVLTDQLNDTLKALGRLISSTSVALRQAAHFCETFVRALRPLCPKDTPESVLIAEAMRFTARISAAKESLSLDDVLAVDELLDRFDLPLLAYQIQSEDFTEALKQDRFLRTDRFLLALPLSLGRARLSSVPPDLLREHVSAWCASRSQLYDAANV